MSKTKYQETLVQDFPVAERRMHSFALCKKNMESQDNLQHPVQQVKKMTASDCLDNFLTTKQLLASHSTSNHYGPKCRTRISQRFAILTRT
jgi:hypothetical protein